MWSIKEWIVRTLCTVVIVGITVYLLAAYDTKPEVSFIWGLTSGVLSQIVSIIILEIFDID